MFTRQVRRFLFFCSITILSVGFLAGQFILERKEKKPSRVSTNLLREQCAKEMGDIMQIIPGIMHELANVSSITLAHIYTFVDGEKCFLLSEKKDQLISRQQKIAAWKQQLITIKQTLQELSLFLQSLNSTESAKNKPVKSKKLVEI